MVSGVVLQHLPSLSLCFMYESLMAVLIVTLSGHLVHTHTHARARTHKHKYTHANTHTEGRAWCTTRMSKPTGAMCALQTGAGVPGRPRWWPVCKGLAEKHGGWAISGQAASGSGGQGWAIPWWSSDEPHPLRNLGVLFDHDGPVHWWGTPFGGSWWPTVTYRWVAQWPAWCGGGAVVPPPPPSPTPTHSHSHPHHHHHLAAPIKGKHRACEAPTGGPPTMPFPASAAANINKRTGKHARGRAQACPGCPAGGERGPEPWRGQAAVQCSLGRGFRQAEIDGLCGRYGISN